VGGHRPSALHRATGLEEHDRLSGCGLGEGTAEVPTISDALEIENDDASLGVLGRRFQESALVEVDLVPETREEGKSKPSVPGPVEDGRGERARVGDEADGAGQRHARGERRIQATGGTDPPETVRPENPDRLTGQPCPQRVLARTPFLGPLAKAGRDDDRPPHPLGHTFLQCWQHRRGRDGDDGQVHGLVRLEERSYCRQALHTGGVRIDRHNSAWKPCRTQVGQDASAYLGGIARSSDDRDTFGCEERSQTLSRHRGVLWTGRGHDVDVPYEARAHLAPGVGVTENDLVVTRNPAIRRVQD